jgi:hypothetical protein
MTCVDLRPELLDDIVADEPAARSVPRWLRWLAAIAVFSPGGGLVYDVLTDVNRRYPASVLSGRHAGLAEHGKVRAAHVLVVQDDEPELRASHLS